MVKRVKKIFMVFLVANVIAFTLTGCFQRQNIVAVVGDEAISEPLYRIFLWQTQRGMESLDTNIWKLDNVGGKSPEEIAKERALDSIRYHVVAQKKAKELGIELTKEDKQQIKESAKIAYDNNASINEIYNLKQGDYESFYSYMKLSEKVLATLGESYEPSVEEIKEEIRKMQETGIATGDEATIVQVFIKTTNEMGESIPEDKKQEAYEKAQEVLQAALQGQALSELAASYSEDSAVVENGGQYTFKRGMMDPALETVVFEKATIGEVYPEVVTTADGYEIVEVLERVSNQAKLEQEAIRRIGVDYASTQLQEMCNLVQTEVKEGYETIHLMSENAQETQEEK